MAASKQLADSWLGCQNARAQKDDSRATCATGGQHHNQPPLFHYGIALEERVWAILHCVPSDSFFCNFYAFRGCSAMSPLRDTCQFSPIVSQETAIDWRGAFVRFERLALAKPAGQHHQNTRFVFTINFYGN
jgi:hypothetical protein